MGHNACETERMETMDDTEKQSDLSRAFSEDGALKTHVGGQALLEGIMMRGKYNWSVAVREPDGGVYLEEHDLPTGQHRARWLYWPFFRGCRAFVESLALGFKALSIAAEHAFAGEDDGEGEADRPPAAEAAVKADGTASPAETAPCTEAPVPRAGAMETPAAAAAEPKPEPVLGSKEMGISMALGLLLGVVLFVVAPAFVTNLIVGEYDQHTLAWNIVDGLLRIAIFIFYIWLIGRMEDIQRMFGYHGAEHKAIHCFEHGLPLTPQNARSFPRLHVRCGTAFLIMVMILAIFIYTVLPIDALIGALGVPDGAPKLALVIAVRILLIPLIAGIAYEITVKWAGTHPNNPLVKAVLWPGLQMQYLTTREPDDGQIECAIAAMERVLEREQREEAAAGA